ncbi:MAG: DEAD/DEAH box helicase [Chloroflexi bacterium]|nr:DEAD/DEAH box helicase [Chloroflexota bacterium]
MTFTEFFSTATGWLPYAYQARLGDSPNLPVLLRIPTGAGKTEAATLTWLYRLIKHPDQEVRDSTPRRLLYCLPMRTLVEQTMGRINEWINNLGMAGEVKAVTLLSLSQKSGCRLGCRL